MFSIIAIALTTLATVHAQETAQTFGWGASWRIGAMSSTAPATSISAASPPNIIEAITTLNPGAPPADGSYGEVYMWPGLTNGTGDLLRTSVEYWPQGTSWCGGSDGEWCLRTRYFRFPNNHDGPYAPVPANTPVTIHFLRSADGSTWTQTATVNGNVISNITSNSGPMTSFGISTEYQDDFASPTSTQTYTNTRIVLDRADPNWGLSAGIPSTGNGTSINGLQGSQGGKVWTVDEIVIPPGIAMQEE